MKRHELTDQQWGLLAPFCPPRPRKRGGPWRDDRTIRNGIFWRLRSGAAWRDLPRRYGPWQTVSDRFNQMRKSGLLDRIIQRLQWRRNEAGRIEAELFCHAASPLRTPV
jgi:transposase